MNRTREAWRDGRLYSGWVLALLTLTYILNYLDRQLLAVLAEPIKRDLGLSDTQVGLLTGTIFALFYAVFGIPAAYLADRTHRVRVVAVACAGWSIFTGLCGLAHGFSHLALARMGVGIGEAGGPAPSFSLVSQYFSARRRGIALAVFTLAVPVGSSLGGIYGSYMATRYGWRLAFILLALPGFLLAVLLLVGIREPPRDRGDATSVPLRDTLAFFWRSPQLRSILLTSAVGAFVMFIQLAWTPAYLMRVKGMSMGQLGTFYSPCVGLSVCAGTLLSGFSFDALLRRTPRVYGLIPAISLGAALPFYLAGLYEKDLRLAVPLLAASQCLSVMYQVPAVAATQNFLTPRQRSTGSAVLLLFLNVVALGLGPVFVGSVSDFAVAAYGKASLGIAMLAVAPFFLLGSGAGLITAHINGRRATPTTTGSR